MIIITALIYACAFILLTGLVLRLVLIVIDIHLPLPYRILSMHVKI